MLKELSYQEFKELKNGSRTYILFFTADWCDSCKMAKQPLEELQHIYDIYQVNVETNSLITTSCHIASVPTTIVVFGDRIIAKESGYRSKEYYLNLLQNN